MSGRHRVPPARRPSSRRVVRALAPVLVAAGAVVAVVALVLDGPFTRGPEPVAAADRIAAPAAPRSGPLLRLPPSDRAADAASGAVRAATVRAERDEVEKERRSAAVSSGSGVCDLDGPPRFDNPADPNEITNRDCGYVDEQGRQRSRDVWIDGQLLAAQGG